MLVLLGWGGMIALAGLVGLIGLILWLRGKR
jgi:hypothetical protein